MHQDKTKFIKPQAPKSLCNYTSLSMFREDWEMEGRNQKSRNWHGWIPGSRQNKKAIFHSDLSGYWRDHYWHHVVSSQNIRAKGKSKNISCVKNKSPMLGLAVLVTWQTSITKIAKAGVRLHCPSLTTNLLKGVGPRVGWWGSPPLPPGLETAWHWLDGTTAAPAPSTSCHGGIASAFLWEKATSGLEQFPLLSCPVCVGCCFFVGVGWGACVPVFM